MKKTVIGFLTFCMIWSCTKKEEVQPTKGVKTTNKLEYVVSEPVDALQYGWSVRYNCLHNRGNCAIVIAIGEYSNEDGVRPVRLTMLDSTHLSIENLDDIPNDDGNYLEFSTLTSLPSGTATSLGYTSITIQTGLFSTSFDVNAFGTTVVSVLSE
jgi:hypothetical protein